MGDVPQKIQGGRKTIEQNQEKERKIKNNSKIVKSQQPNGPKLMSFRGSRGPQIVRPRRQSLKIFELPPPRQQINMQISKFLADPPAQNV